MILKHLVGFTQLHKILEVLERETSTVETLILSSETPNTGSW